uniref:3'-5' exonuclease domain-containing protein n=1 Tax=Steinernema glaseri TaxID=37863 RepID=A0A1I7Y632_9BILA
MADKALLEVSFGPYKRTKQFDFKLRRLEVNADGSIQETSLGRLPSKPVTCGPKPEEFDAKKIIFVTNSNELKMLIDVLNKEKEIAVDLEFFRPHDEHFIIGLIQISTWTQDYIIDPLALKEKIALLGAIFANDDIMKVFHGFFDVRMLITTLGFKVMNVLNTYQLTRVLGVERSLQDIVRKYCNVFLDKSRSRKWSKRPLTFDMINYAARDTHYLLYCADRLREEVETRRTNHEDDLLQEAEIKWMDCVDRLPQEAEEMKTTFAQRAHEAITALWTLLVPLLFSVQKDENSVQKNENPLQKNEISVQKNENPVQKRENPVQKNENSEQKRKHHWRSEKHIISELSEMAEKLGMHSDDLIREKTRHELSFCVRDYVSAKLYCIQSNERITEEVLKKLEDRLRQHTGENVRLVLLFDAGRCSYRNYEYEGVVKVEARPEGEEKKIEMAMENKKAEAVEVRPKGKEEHKKTEVVIEMEDSGPVEEDMVFYDCSDAEVFYDCSEAVEEKPLIVQKPQKDFILEIDEDSKSWTLTPEDVAEFKVPPSGEDDYQPVDLIDLISESTEEIEQKMRFKKLLRMVRNTEYQVDPEGWTLNNIVIIDNCHEKEIFDNSWDQEESAKALTEFSLPTAKYQADIQGDLINFEKDSKNRSKKHRKDSGFEDSEDLIYFDKTE